MNWSFSPVLRKPKTTAFATSTANLIDQRFPKVDPYTAGARAAKYDTYVDGAKAGKFNPYADGAKAGKFDVNSDGARYEFSIDHMPL
nr:hypothetical protein [Cupriavidus sp. AcVe19-6a]